MLTFGRSKTMNAIYRYRWIVILLAVAFLAASCGKKVSRIQSGEVKDLSGRWNDTDSQQVSQAMIKDSLSWPWINQWIQKRGKNPAVMAIGVKNKGNEHINTRTFMKDLERAFLRSGRVTVVADSDQRKSVRAERSDQQAGNVGNPSAVGRELGADFVLTGELNTIADQEGGKKIMFYQINLELISVETNAKVWIGDKKIKKFIEKSKLGF